jgi:hypothetical protein
MRLRCGVSKEAPAERIHTILRLCTLVALAGMFSVDGFNLGNLVVALIVKLFTGSRAIS